MILIKPVILGKTIRSMGDQLRKLTDSAELWKLNISDFNDINKTCNSILHIGVQVLS